jgi:ribosomal protein L24
MGVDDITERIRGMNINKNVGFKHSIYGIIRRGGDKGKEAEIREYYPSKYDVMLDIRGYISIGKDMKAGDKIMECEVISEVERIGDMVKYLVSCKKMILFSKKNIKISGDKVKVLKGENRGMIGKLIKEHKAKLLVSLEGAGTRITRFIDVDDIFYKDILLKSGEYFQVNRIERDNKTNYKIYGMEMGGESKLIMMSDIKKMMPGMDIIGNKKVVEDVEKEEYISEEISDDISEEISEIDEEEIEEDIEDEFRSSYKDVERTEIITQQLNIIQRGYYDMIKMILDISGESIDNINVYDIIDNIEGVVDKLNKLIKSSNINFDISGSKIDMKIMISLLVAYEMQRGELIFEGLSNYVRNLFNRNFFYSTLDEMMVSFLLRKDNEIFKCDTKLLRDLYKSKKYYEILEKIILCFNDVLKVIISSPVDLSAKKFVEIEKVERIQKDKKRIITFEDIKMDNIVVDARRVLWDPESEKIVNDFKDLLIKSSKTVDGEIKMEIDEKRISILEDKRGLYKYVYENLDIAPMVLYDIGQRLIKVLSERYDKFGVEYKECGGKVMCGDKVIMKYLEMFFDKKGKMRGVSEGEYLDMKRYYELSRIFDRLINRINERVRKPKKELKEERIRTKELEKEKILQSRKRVIKSLEGVDELLEEFESVKLSDLVKKRRN